MNRMNNRGDVAVVFFAFVVVVLFGAALFSLIQNVGKVTAIVEDSRFVDEAYAKENEIGFYVSFTGDRIIRELYILNKEEGEEKAAEAVLQFFPLTFQSEVREMVRNDIPLGEFARKVENGEFELIYDENEKAFEFRMNDLVYIGDLIIDEEDTRRWVWRGQPEDYSDKEIRFIAGVIYRADLRVEFDLDELVANEEIQ